MTRMNPSTPQNSTSQGCTTPNLQRKQMNQSTAVQQYAINRGVCTMNFFGAGSAKNDW
ncbi:hypothetical protein [Anoxynatronum buryatiense]|uniref:Uncharacterized protein n=1 Tax=Anoxynatronum buryatiense TaxID=489973 RepID=A0AA45WUR3_9CLOT|nr:hypothetical protein [Anoxynatronum buryatiense]SMP44755.1 hypothetical protein SAMN06296020_102227 [Anoxynatronum buryatiense]